MSNERQFEAASLHASRVHALGRQLLRYCVVGGCGFAVEAALLALLQYGAGWSALPCRAVSFPAAVVVTYWLNHRYTFGTEGGWPELVRYIGSQGAGLAANLVVYTAAILLVPLFASHALVPLGIGSAAGLAVNFSLAKFFVFTASQTRQGLEERG